MKARYNRKTVQKQLIIINGTMGVGKTTICKELYKIIPKVVWLDGDWCWMMNPWLFSEENKNMVVDNITYLLRNFLKNPSFDYVLFSWVIHQETIFDIILGRLQDLKFESHKITLICSAEALRSRMQKDSRDENGIKKSIERLKLYESQNTTKIDTTSLSVPEVTLRILGIISSERD